MNTQFLSDNKYLIGGLAVAGIAVYFLFFRDGAKSPTYGNALMPGVDLVDVSKGAKLSGVRLSINGSTNSISTLISQIRTREISSGIA